MYKGLDKTYKVCYNKSVKRDRKSNRQKEVKTMMKKMVAMVMVMMMVVCVMVNASAEMVQVHGVVCAINLLDDTFLVITDDGNVWELEEVEDWQLLDECFMLMDTKDTEAVEDDEVVWCHYIGAMDWHEFNAMMHSFED